MNFLTNLLPKVSTIPRIRRQRSGLIKSEYEIKIMRQAGAIVATVLKQIADWVEPGMTTMDIDQYAERCIRSRGAIPSFKGYYGFPASVCVCLNDEVVHGIPNRKKVLRAGDVLKIDTGAFYEGFHGDSCITIPVGQVSEHASRLIQVAQETLQRGIEQVKAGNDLLDIAGAIQDYAEAHGFSIVEDFTGHGVGRNLHEAPSVFNVRECQLPNVKLRAGMTLAIEPILNAGAKYTRTLPDRWTVVTLDRSLSAQFEHTVLVTDMGYEILTDRTKIHELG